MSAHLCVAKPKLRLHRLGEILRGRPNVNGEIVATKNAQLAHNSDIILRIDEITPALHVFEVDGDGDVRCYFERVPVIADFDHALM